MSAKSIIYRHIYIYRFMMNFLYIGKYKKRFTSVIAQIMDLPPNSKVLELCFGDIYIADYCKTAGHNWKGFDLNEHFVKQAQKLGYNACFEDLNLIKKLPRADVCIMMGSLYHFHLNTFSILSKMIKASDLIIISEPISNLSTSKGLIGFFARRAANVGKGKEEFRYDKTSLLTMLNDYKDVLNYRIVFAQQQGKDFIVKLKKNGSIRY